MRNAIRPVLILSATLLAAGAFAGPLSKNEEIKLDRPTVVSGTVLPAGTYSVRLTPNLDAASFVQGKRTLAVAACKVGLADVAYRGNAVHTRGEADGPVRLVKLVFGDSKLALEFPFEAPGSDDPSVASAVDGH